MDLVSYTLSSSGLWSRVELW